MSPAQFHKVLSDEVKVVEKNIKEAGIRLNSCERGNDTALRAWCPKDFPVFNTTSSRGNTMQMTRIFEKSAMFAAAALLAGTAFLSNTETTQAQQGWPTPCGHDGVPYGPGASNDTFTRALSQIFHEEVQPALRGR